MKLTIYGVTPSKKNQRRPFVRNGRMMNFPSKRYEVWHKGAQSQLIQHWNAKIERCTRVEIVIYAPDKRLFDISNRGESIMDLLVDCGILVDDNYKVVPEIVLRYGGVNKASPRAEVVIIT